MKKLSMILAGLFVLTACSGTAAPTTTGGAASTTPAATTQAATTTAATTAAATTPAKAEEIILATTTSTQDSGLLDYLLPEFKKDTGIEVKVVAKGTGASIEIAKNGDADVLLVHAKAQEEQFVTDGFGLERYDVCYNDYIIVGPKTDPVGIKDTAPADPIKAFKTIRGEGAKFVSRGDESGTHTKEKSIWKLAEIEPSGDWYVSAGKGMGDVLTMTSELLGYTLSDRATYLSMKDKLDLQIVTEGDKALFNQYGIIRLNPAKNADLKVEAADQFIAWMLSDKGQKMIGEYGTEKYGAPLFYANPK